MKPVCLIKVKHAVGTRKGSTNLKILNSSQDRISNSPWLTKTSGSCAFTTSEEVIRLSD